MRPRDIRTHSRSTGIKVQNTTGDGDANFLAHPAEWRETLIEKGLAPEMADSLLARRLQLMAEREKAASTSEGASDELPFFTAASLLEGAPETVDWIIAGLIARGAITEIDGKVKASGKTTLAMAMCRSLLDGESFLDFAVNRTKIVYLTEQSRSTIAIALRRAHITRNDVDFHMLTRYDFRSRDWASVVRIATDHCKKIGADLLIVDTIAKLAGVQEENANKDWDKALTPLMDATNEGLAVLFLRHSGKNPGSVGDSGRGHSSASGDVDIILNLKSPEGNHPPNYRQLDGIGRYDEVPERIIIAMQDGRYENKGTDRAVAVSTAENFLTEMLAAHSALPETGNGEANLVALGMKYTPAINKNSISAALRRLLDAGTITRRGGGVKGDPFFYRLAPVDEDPESE